MRLKAKSVIFGVPAVMAIVMVTLLAVWAFGGIGGGADGAFGEGGFVTGKVSYIHRDATGAIIDQKTLDNATTSFLLDDAAARLSENITPGTDIWVQIAICSTNPNVGQSDGFTPSGVCVLQGNTTEANPTAALTPVNGTNKYTLTTTFTANAGSVDIDELQLVQDTGDGVAPLDADVGATRDVTIVLESGDTLDITWDVTIS